MNSSEQPVSGGALDQVDEKRRGFLTKLLAGSTAMAAVPMLSTIALAEPGENAEGKGKGGKGKGKGGQAGKGKGQGRTQDPAEMAKRMMKEFDKDGDQKLSLRELTAALTAIQKRRESGRGEGKGKGDGKGKGKGKGKGQSS